MNSRSVSSEAPAQKVLLEITDFERQQYMQVRQQRMTAKQSHILIVEDQLFSRNLLYGLLSANYTVDAVATVQEGWSVFLNQAPDVSFLDIELEDASGHMLARSIKEFDPTAFVVMVTANHDLEDVREARNNKVDGFVAKPFSKQKIEQCINKYRGISASTLKGKHA